MEAEDTAVELVLGALVGLLDAVAKEASDSGINGAGRI
jgi:hypothetical protein